VTASQEASPPRAPVNATNSPATVPYVRTVDTARSAARSHAWNRATASAPTPDSLLTEREYRRSTAPCAAYSLSIWATLNK
jgi:hypothetical protein